MKTQLSLHAGDTISDILWFKENESERTSLFFQFDSSLHILSEPTATEKLSKYGDKHARESDTAHWQNPAPKLPYLVKHLPADTTSLYILTTGTEYKMIAIKTRVI